MLEGKTRHLLQRHVPCKPGQNPVTTISNHLPSHWMPRSADGFQVSGSPFVFQSLIQVGLVLHPTAFHVGRLINNSLFHLQGGIFLHSLVNKSHDHGLLVLFRDKIQKKFYILCGWIRRRPFFHNFNCWFWGQISSCRIAIICSALTYKCNKLGLFEPSICIYTL